MLKTMRENVKYLSWILWVVVALFILFVFVDFGTGIRQRGGNGAVAAWVGGDTVSMTEFERSYRQLDEQNRQMYGEQYTPEIAKQMRLPLQALDRLVDEKILLAEARRMGLETTDAELRDAILTNPTFQDGQGHFVGEAEYARTLQENRQSIAGFEEETRKQLLFRKVVDVLRSNSYVSDADVDRAYREQVERARIRYVELPRNRFMQGTEIPQAELAAYWSAHRSEYRLPEQREGAYALVEMMKLINDVKVGDSELLAYYQGHQDEWSQKEQVRAKHVLVMVNDKQTDEAAQKRIAEVKARLDKGEDFAKVASQVSEDQASKANGGDLGFFGRGQMVKPFEDAAFGAPTGKLVGPVKSTFGYHLLVVTDHRAGGVRPFQEVREQIRTQVALDKARQVAEAKAKDLAQRLAKDKPKSVEALQAALKNDPAVSVSDTGKFALQDPIRGLGRVAPLNAAAFALKKGDLSAAVQVSRGWAILYLKDIYPAHTSELAEVEAKVRLAVAVQKQNQMANEKIAAAAREVQQGKTLDQVAAELGVPAKETAEFGAQQTMVPGLGYSPEVVRAALGQPVGKVIGPVASQQGAVLFQVTGQKG
ncbi:MAG: SurA N-terminal domain-containing protein, partial [Acidobacteriota bacterium]|nr:SurA N-terminal domain-containing protein [Acidobacteriota bacterium]